MSNISIHIDRFYSLLSRLQALSNQGLPLNAYNGKSKFPLRGVYFFLETGEYRSSTPSTQRVVRVGTHAVSAGSNSTLWKRLKAHLGPRTGKGNHRGSIFRLHVGAALLTREGKIISTWGEGASAPKAVHEDETVKEAEEFWEQKVSQHIGSMRVLWVDVPDAPGPNSDRAFIERNAIALLSNRLTPIEKASSNWLGNFSPREHIRLSNLWNLKHVCEIYDPLFLDKLEAAVERTEKQL